MVRSFTVSSRIRWLAAAYVLARVASALADGAKGRLRIGADFWYCAAALWGRTAIPPAAADAPRGFSRTFPG